ncbi:serine/threonine-protein kinase [Micromonospora deserti]|uniref:serine/threonine-protein kinase n=1 Tax=Micromonospora deserti TaxID=2070366 RepID=UPI001F395687|nr:serine/threonine-protein kinase [Micromonospora deserti]
MQRDQLLAGRYRLGERLGKGGMSVVWRAHDEVLERDVAVKVLVASDPAARRRIRGEAKAAARLSHPNVTNVYDYGESRLATGHVPFVVMELLSGQTLAQRLTAGPLPPKVALRVCAEVAAGLAAAHAEGLVHRDVKPENVMLTPTGAKVVDFGIAAVAGTPEIDFEGRLLGTPAYLAPERLDAGEVLPASDVYALGLLVHHVLTGRLPWRSETQTGMLRAHAYAEPGPLPAVDGVPPEVGRLHRWCLAKDPVDRPSSAEGARILAAAVARMPDVPAVSPPVPAEPSGPPPADAVPAGAPPAGTPAAGTGPALRPLAAPTGAGDGGGAVPGWTSRLGSRALVAVAATVVGVVALAGSLGDPSLRQPDTAQLPPTGPDTGGTASVALPLPADGPPRPDAPGSDAPARSAAAGRSVTAPALPPSAGATATRPAPTGGAGPTTAPSGVDVGARGGVVTVRCDGKSAEVVRVAPAAGYQVGAYQPGPAREVRVELVGAGERSVVTVRCANGRPVARVKEDPPVTGRPDMST